MIAAYLDKTLMWRAAFHSPPQQDTWMEKSFMPEACWDCGLKFNTVLRLKGLASFRPEVDILGNTNTEQSIYQFWVDLNRRKTHVIWVRSAAVILPSSVQTSLQPLFVWPCDFTQRTNTSWVYSSFSFFCVIQQYDHQSDGTAWSVLESNIIMTGWVFIVLNRLQYFCGCTYRDGDTVASSSSPSTLSAQKPQLYSVLWDLEKQRELQGHTTYDSITSITTLARLDDILTLMWMNTRLWWLTTAHTA